MKKTLLCVYSSLLLTSLISSGVLFVLVASEIGSNSSQDSTISINDDSVNLETIIQDQVEQEGASNLVKDDNENTPEEIHSSFEDLSVHRLALKVEEAKQTEPDIPFQESTVNQEFSESGEGAVVYTLVDSATSELQQQAASSSSIPPEQPVQNKSVPRSVPLPLPSESDAPNTTTAQYIVRAEPKVAQTPPQNQPVPDKINESVTEEEESISNETSTTPLEETTAPSDAHEDIPSFSEWAQKQLEEAEKKKDENTTGGGGIPSGSGIKMRNKNYASPDCGAKVVAANPEALSAGSLLSSSRDEYMLNTCTSRIWFIVELCEAIQPRKIELANFELFSSSPKEFSVYLSDRFPTRDWTNAGTFTAQDERNIQAFTLHRSNFFGKYVKVEIHSHYGSEHYCPVSLFRMYGTSEFEVLDTVEARHASSAVVNDDDDDDDDDDEILTREGSDAPKNLFGSARDAVLSIVKKAAEVLVKTPEEATKQDLDLTNDNLIQPQDEKDCATPSYIVVCVNCSDQMYNRVYHLLSCQREDLEIFLHNEFVRNTLLNSEVCSSLGLDLKSGAPYPEKPIINNKPKAIDYLKSLLLPETLSALCNILAIGQKKVVLNISYEQPQETNKTQLERNNPLEEVFLEPAATCNMDNNIHTSAPNTPDLVSSFSTVTTNGEHVPTGQIKPTKTLTKEQHLSAPAEVSQGNNASILAKNITVEKPAVVQPTITMELNDSKDLNPDIIPLEIENISLIEITDEATVDPLSLDSLFSELEKAVVPNLPEPATVTPPQKESVFVRLANRIKALERNMSLSGQYLEELSRRYKRQVEEMQKALVAAAEERKRGEEREEKTGEQLLQLTEKVADLTVIVETLLHERDSWQHKASMLGQHGVLIVVEVLVFALVLYACRWVPNVEVSSRKFSVAWKRSFPERRKSVDDTTGNPKPKLKKRRPSEEALKISGTTHQELLIYDNRASKGENRRRRRKRRELALKAAAEVNGIEMVDVDERGFLNGTSTENMTAWWEEDVFQKPSAPPYKSDSDQVLPPVYVQTALSQRQDRLSRSTSSDITIDHKKDHKATFLPLKKPGPFKKIVKKFF